MREIFQIIDGEHEGKHCYIVNRLNHSFRVCIGSDEDKKYVKIPKNYVDEDNPLKLDELLEILNGYNRREV